MDLGSYGEYAIDLANTWAPSEDDPELLPDRSALRSFLREHLGLDRDATDEDLETLRRARQDLRAILLADDDRTAVALLNDLMRRHPVSPVVSGHDGRDWHLHLAEDDRPVGELVVAAAAFGLTVLLLDVGIDRRGQCGHESCQDVFVDGSRGHTRRYCSSSCSNRANVAAYRARQRQR